MDHEKLFKCLGCSETFLTENQLIHHSNVIHFDFLENSFDEFECDMCGDTFNDEERLKKHEENDHTPVEYHTCDECGYILIDEEKMKKHKLKEHGSKFKFQDCDSKFATS